MKYTIQYDNSTGEILSYAVSNDPNEVFDEDVVLTGLMGTENKRILDVTNILPSLSVGVQELALNYYVSSTKQLIEYSLQAKEVLKLLADNRAGKHWDARTETLTDTRDLPDLLFDKLLELKNTRNLVINGGFIYNLDIYDSDQVSQTRILGAYNSSITNPDIFPISWRLKDNTWADLSAENIQGLWLALQTHIQVCFQAYRTHETAIKALTTKEDVLAYDITTGWNGE